MDQPHSVHVAGPTGEQTYYYAIEESGHVKALIDASNNVVTQYAYTPWGEVAATGTVTQPLRYMAREYDETTGLYNVRARWYDPHQGRFVSEDLIGLAGGINPYAYVSNDPTNSRDPSGLCEGERYTEETTCHLDGVTTVAPPVDPCARGKCWDRGGGGAGGAGGARGGGPPEGNNGTNGTSTSTGDSSDTPSPLPTFKTCMGNAGASAMAAGTVAASAVVGGVGKLAQNYGGQAVAEGSNLLDRFFATKPPYLASSALAEDGMALMSNGRAAAAFGNVATRASVIVGGLTTGYFLGAAGMCAADRNYYSQ